MIPFLSKTIGFVLMLLVGFVFAVDVKAAPEGKCLIGYGYATTVLSKPDQENFLWGFRYGLAEAFKTMPVVTGPCQSFNNIDILVVASDSTSSPLESVRVSEDLAAKGVVLLAGFPSSHEALLAARVAQQNKMAFISMGAVANDLAQYRDYIFTTSPKRFTYAHDLIKGLMHRVGGKEILVVAKRDLVFSMENLNTMIKENEAQGSVMKITPIFVDQNLSLEKNSWATINPETIGAVYITLYPDISKMAFLELQDRLKSDVTFFVSSAWISNKIGFFGNIPLSTKQRVIGFGAGVPHINSDELKPMRDAYETQLKKTPEMAVFEGYEGGVYAANLLYNAKAGTREAVLTAIKTTTCIKAKTQGELCRNEEGFSNKKLRFYRWTENGYVPEEE